MAYSTKSRVVAPELWLERGVNVDRPGFTPQWSQYSRAIPAALQETYSWRTGPQYEDTPFSDEQEVREWLSVTRNGFQADLRYDNGHEFWTVNRQSRLSHPEVFLKGATTGPYAWYAYRGALRPNWYSTSSSQESGGFAPRAVMSQNDVNVAGSRLIRDASPTNPHASVSIALGELISDGLPRFVGSAVLQTRASRFRALGSEYLNVEFGWKPFIADLQRVVEAVLESSKIVTQYERDAGRVVRRRRVMPDVVSTANAVGFTNQDRPCLPIFGGGGIGRGFAPLAEFSIPVTREINSRQSTWLSGAFQYYVHTDKTVLGRLVRFEELANQLLGTRITPEVLWELAPWSWLADWFANVGSILSNASMLTNDGLVLRYAYLCRTTVEVRNYRLDRPAVLYSGAISPRATYVTTTKERFRASPYGFGVSLDSLTGRQWAILGALGLTKGPKSLRG